MVEIVWQRENAININFPIKFSFANDGYIFYCVLSTMFLINVLLKLNHGFRCQVCFFYFRRFYLNVIWATDEVRLKKLIYCHHISHFKWRIFIVIVVCLNSLFLHCFEPCIEHCSTDAFEFWNNRMNEWMDEMYLNGTRLFTLVFFSIKTVNKF